MRERVLVLVVDDDERTLELVRDILVARRIDVLTTTNGFEGVELARERSPDLVILDVIMPGLDGYKTCALLKKDPQLRTIPILMFTAADEVKFNERAFKAGAAFCLAKPFEPSRLLSLVGLALGKADILPPPLEAERRQQQVRRYFARYPVSVQATGGTGESREAAGLTGNVSAGGVFCTLPERFPVMTPVLVRVETPVGPVAFGATVVWSGSSSTPGPDAVPHGMRIVEPLTATDATRWTQVIQALEGAPLPDPEENQGA